VTTQLQLINIIIIIIIICVLGMCPVRFGVCSPPALTVVVQLPEFLLADGRAVYRIDHGYIQCVRKVSVHLGYGT
jgi:hypothetical protein